VSPLSRRRLEWLVRARGTDLSTWPDKERLAALELLRRSPEAQLAFADALVNEDAPEIDGAVFARMQAALRRSLAPLSLLTRGLRAGALLACVAGGLYVATSQDLSASQADPDGLTDPFTSAQTISLATLDQ
jgi:hypothetical protein